MTLLIAEGFDDGMHKERIAAVNGVTNCAVSASYGMDGAGANLGDAGNRYWSKRLPVTDYVNRSYTMGTHIKVNSASGVYLFGVSSSGVTTSYSGSYLGAVVRISGSTFGVRDQTGTLYAATDSFTLGTWYYLELQVNVADSPDGWWELRSDGVTILSATNRDTRPSTGDVHMTFGGSFSDDNDSFNIDNLYILDSTGTENNDFLGICRVDTLIPDGNGATSDWTGSDGNQTDNYLLVDDASVTTDYVAASTEGDTDTYALPALAGTEGVLGVVATLLATKTDSGAKFVRPVSRSGGVDYPGGTSVSLADATYLAAVQIMDEDPDTSAAWSIAGVNALEAGSEVRDS